MFRVSGFGFRVSGFGFRVSGFGFRVSDFGFRVSDFGFRVSGSWFRVSGADLVGGQALLGAFGHLVGTQQLPKKKNTTSLPPP